MLVQESIGTAVDAIKANKLRSILTTLAIIIGTAAVIACRCECCRMAAHALRHAVVLATLATHQTDCGPGLRLLG